MTEKEVLKEIEVRTVTKESEPEVVKESSQDPLVFVMIGVAITLFAIAVALVVIWYVLKQRRKSS